MYRYPTPRRTDLYALLFIIDGLNPEEVDFVFAPDIIAQQLSDFLQPRTGKNRQEWQPETVVANCHRSRFRTATLGLLATIHRRIENRRNVVVVVAQTGLSLANFFFAVSASGVRHLAGLKKTIFLGGSPWENMAPRPARYFSIVAVPVRLTGFPVWCSRLFAISISRLADLAYPSLARVDIAAASS